MKITFLLLFCSLVNLVASTSYSQNTKISLSLKNATIEEVLNKIEDESEFYFLFNQKLVNVQQKVDIEADNEPIKDILDEILTNDIKYVVLDRQIILTSGTKSESTAIPLQQKKITGTITDEAGSPLPGVNIMIEGTTIGVLSDSKGEYSISVPNENAVIIFSFIGFQSQKVSVSNRTTISPRLIASETILNEVVVTALGIKREARSIGYSATSVNTEQIINSPSVNVGNALIGKIAGVSITTPPSGAGGSSRIRIRGNSSFGGNNSPLIVVNGVPINNTPNFAMGPFAGDFGDGLQSINPDDIETMTVLKGASAAALYGFRAKDGVIIMTTKAGRDKIGIGVELNSTFTVNRAIDALDDYQYEYGQGEGGLRPASLADARSSGTWSFGTRFDGQPVWCIDGLEHPYVPFKDRIDAAFQTGTVTNNTLALSGGNENGNIRLSITNTDSKNIIPNSSFNKKILSLGSNIKFGEKLSAQLNGNYSIENNINPFASSGYSSFTCAVLEAANSIDPRWTKNNYKDPVTGDEIPWTRAVDHPNWDWIANERGSERKQDRIFGNVLLRYDLAPWLYLQGRVGQDYFTADTWTKIPTGALNLAPVASGYNGGFSQGTNSFREINADFMVGANKKFGDFGTNLTFGGNAMQQINKGLSVSVTNFYVRDLYDIANGQIKVPRYTYSEKKVNSLYGSMDLSFKDYLYLTLTLRNDWFSTLNPLSNSYLYPSISSSFLFSQAFPSLMPSWLTYGKLRASYAEVGGDTDPYTNALYYYIQPNNFGNYPYGAISGSVSPNANLSPLKVKEAEVGLELIFFDRRISLDMAVYQKYTVDEILNVDISRSSGYSGTKVNVGKLRNQGIESLLTLVPVRTQNFSWQIGFNYTYNESEVLQLAGGQTRINVGSGTWIGRVSQEVGMPMGSIRGTDYLRDDQGRIITVQGRFQAGKEITFGSGLPPHMGGFLNTFTYKGISVFAQVDFKAGKDFKIISHTAYDGYRKGHVKATLVGRREGENGVVFEGVNQDGTPNTTAVECQTFYTDYASKKVSTPLVYNGSFVRWRTLSLGYDFSKLLRNTSIRGLTLNANINNVLVFKSYIPNLDPECVSTVSDTRMGIEEVAAPATRDYSISLNIKF